MYKLVLLRHGQSTWNLENRFTGWTDVGLPPQGEAEAHTAAKLLEEGGFTFDLAFTSVLKRAIKTLWIVMEDMNLEWMPVYRHWRLNERHYGDRKSTRLNSSHQLISYAVFCLKKKTKLDGGNGHSGKRSPDLHFGLGRTAT